MLFGIDLLGLALALPFAIAAILAGTGLVNFSNPKWYEEEDK